MEETKRADVVIRHRTELILLVSALVVLGISALAVTDGTVPSAERTIFRWVNDLPGFIYWPVYVVMQLGNVVTVFVVAALAALFRRFRLATGLLLAGLGAFFAAKFVKDLVARGRPAAVLADVHERGAHVGGAGYVSGHTAVAFALATVATLWFGRKGQIVLWTLACVVGLARVYVGAHLPLDVVGGAALGCACGAVGRFVVGARRHGHAARLEDSTT